MELFDLIGVQVILFRYFLRWTWMDVGIAGVIFKARSICGATLDEGED